MKQVLTLMRRIHLHPGYVMISVTFSVLAACFEGVGIGLLVPLLNGFLRRDYSFISETPFFSKILEYLPNVWTSTDRGLFGLLIAAFVIATIMKNVLRYAANTSIAYLSTRTEHHLRKYLFDAYLHMGQEYFDRTSIGQHSTVLLQFTKQAVMPLLIGAKFFQALFPLLAYFVVMMGISWQLTLLAVPVFIVLHFVTRFFVNRIHTFSLYIATQSKAMGKKVVDILSAVRLVRSSATQIDERLHYTLLSDELARLEYRKSISQNLLQPSQELITLFMGLFLFVGMMGLLVYAGVGESSTYLVYFYIVVNAGNKFAALSTVRGDIASVAGPINEVMEIIEESQARVVPSGSKEFYGLKHSLKFHELSFTYAGAVEALRDVSFEAPQGSMIALVGETGSGKSTILNLLLRTYDCAPGRILLDGVDIRHYSTSSLLKHIALVSQETILFHESLRHNITYGVGDVSELHVREAIERARLSDLIERLPNGLETIVGDRGTTLSGGERQRVAIARALLTRASIFLLDEPTSALDAATEQRVQQAIRDAVAGKTAIVVAHRLATVRNADRIIVLHKGEVVEQGTFDELSAKKGQFARLLTDQELA